MQLSDFTIGVDPEIFITEDGKAVSAHGLIPGDKKAPHPIPGGGIQVDGTAVEFNTDPVPLTDFVSFNKNIVKVMGGLEKEVKKAGNYSFNISPVQEYSQEYLDSLPDSAKELGCDPDYCAYTLEPNPVPDGKRAFRTGAGHIHFGWGADIPTDNKEHHEICASFVKMLDATVGLFMITIDRDPRRRELYGKAGAYRAKPYGVEYRFPSNVWLRDKSTRIITHLLMQSAVNYMLSGCSVQGVTSWSEEQIRSVLDTGDWNSAKSIVSRLCYQATAYYRSEKFLKEFPNG